MLYVRLAEGLGIGAAPLHCGPPLDVDSVVVVVRVGHAAASATVKMMLQIRWRRMMRPRRAIGELKAR